MNVFGGRVPGATLMHFWNSHDAESAGWYALSVARHSRSRTSLSNASSMASVSLPTCLSSAASPPKLRGLWIPDASPMAVTRSNPAGSGESR